MRPSRGPLAGDHDGADEHAREQRDQDRRGDGAAEEQPHHAGELDVAHAHATRVGERGEQQEAAGGGAGDQTFGLTGGVERDAEHEREHGAERGDLVGDDPVLEIDQRGGHDDQDQRDARARSRPPSVCASTAPTHSAAVSASTSG